MKMESILKYFVLPLAVLGLLVAPVHAAPVTFFGSGTTSAATGSYNTDFGAGPDYPSAVGGDPVETIFVVDDTLFQSTATGTFVRVYSATAGAGQQYTFNTSLSAAGSPYWSFIQNPVSGAYMDTDNGNSSSLSMIVYDNVAVDFLTAGVSYDQLSLIGTTVNIFGIGDTHSWRLDLYGNASWFSGSGVPVAAQLQNFSSGVGISTKLSITEINPAGTVVGTVDADLTSLGGALVAPVPVPAAVWLLGSGLIGLVAVGRRRQETSLSA